MTFYTCSYWDFVEMSISCLFTMHVLHVLYAKLTIFSEKPHDFHVLFFIQWQKNIVLDFSVPIQNVFTSQKPFQ